MCVSGGYTGCLSRLQRATTRPGLALFLTVQLIPRPGSPSPPDSDSVFPAELLAEDYASQNSHSVYYLLRCVAFIKSSVVTVHGVPVYKSAVVLCLVLRVFVWLISSSRAFRWRKHREGILLAFISTSLL